MEFSDYMPPDINPLNKLVYIKTKEYKQDKYFENYKKLNIYKVQLEILFNCLDFIENIKGCIRYSKFEKSLIKILKYKYKSDFNFSEKLIYKLIFLIRDEIKSIENIYFYSYVKNNIIEYNLGKEKIRKYINFIIVEINKKFLNKVPGYKEILINCYDILTKILCVNYKKKFRNHLLNDHFSILKHLIQNSLIFFGYYNNRLTYLLFYD